MALNDLGSPAAQKQFEELAGPRGFLHVSAFAAWAPNLVARASTQLSASALIPGHKVVAPRGLGRV